LSLPADNGYESRIFYQPHEKVGEIAFGGDWYAGTHAEDGSLWVIVADVTGHGYHAYLLASSPPRRRRSEEHTSELQSRENRARRARDSFPTRRSSDLAVVARGQRL